jgi:hypothetical protein
MLYLGSNRTKIWLNSACQKMSKKLIKLEKAQIFFSCRTYFTTFIWCFFFKFRSKALSNKINTLSISELLNIAGENIAWKQTSTQLLLLMVTRSPFQNVCHNTAQIQHCSISTSWIGSRHWKISTGLHFQNGRHNTAKIQHCSISKVVFNLFFKPVVCGLFGRLHNR